MALGQGMVAGRELNYDLDATAREMADAIFGEGVSVVGASYTGDDRSSAIYSRGDELAENVVPSDRGVILSTGRADQFTNQNNSQSNLSGSRSTNTSGENNNADFNAVAGRSTFDASYLDVSFTSEGDTMTMQFVFASDEYPEYTSSIYNDVLAVWINGSYVPMAVGDGNTSVTSINENNTLNLYKDNTGDQFNTEMDGFTVTLSLTIPVIPTTDPANPQVNTIRIGIADASDSVYDSNVLIAADSVQSVLIAEFDEFTMLEGTTRNLDVLANDTFTGSVEVTHINGVPVSIGDTVILPTGQEVTLKEDYTFDVKTTTDIESVVFTYEVADDDGVTDVGFVEIDTIPCFVAGTLILTPEGERRIETLDVGDLVLTHDGGPQPIRWIGTRTVRAEGALAPIRIEAGALGDHRHLLVSPQHRVLIQDTLSELLFGEPEVLVSAKYLVNDRSIRAMEGGFVTYVHMLFDRHEVVFSEGLATESFLPGPQTTECFEADILEEICAIFPELDPRTGLGYSPAARRTLKAHEARVLMERAA
ncbi:MAG: Hint domain-containing protein [Pseudomonadota bacterium]